jgi:hypothetical protein
VDTLDLMAVDTVIVEVAGADFEVIGCIDYMWVHCMK